jgi:hypothetical protein
MINSLAGCNPASIFHREDTVMTMIIAGSKFRPGRIVSTPRALANVPKPEMFKGLVRHLTGDWGELGEHDRQENEISLIEGFRLLSRYVTPTGKAFLIITEHDRSVTTILLPDEY